MRIDKFIWAVRICKTRTIASEACKSGRIMLNGQNVKSSREVKVGDFFEVKRGAITRKFKVKELLKNRVSAKLVENYITDVTPQEELDKLEMIRISSQSNREKGLGRPTKKERRDIDRLFEYFGYDDDEEDD
ncbi:RNA-binding S4 domain-containing protein [Flexithrix dorotheae]|uniref:RNA-binding S4 domain-containing protein n=1 Tax=Flexithrix dorotheae TaxID=70993 RepID=UPI00035CF98C|nr:RNA-binding S4 domain-containing protein [Flexithrix dorotheae]